MSDPLSSAIFDVFKKESGFDRCPPMQRLGSPLPHPSQQTVWPSLNSPDENKTFVNMCARHLSDGPELRTTLARVIALYAMLNVVATEEAEQLVQQFVRPAQSKKYCCLLCMTEYTTSDPAVGCVKTHIAFH